VCSFGELERVGVEGTGSYGAGLTRHLHAEGVKVIEVDRPNRQKAEIAEIDAILGRLVNETAPELIARVGIGVDSASTLLVAAGDNPERLRSEATFGHLCGASPLDASSGKQEHHRPNRGGDRQANSALWHIVITRVVCDQRTRDHIERRTKGRPHEEGSLPMPQALHRP
jgi:transposase